ncbi:MAG TPA: adenosylcobinamide-phosphate synthase CbiB [Rhizomicrobium sp.]
MVTANLSLMAAALVLDALIGDPRWLYARLPHPIVWMGTLLEWLDARLNKDACRASTRIAWGGIGLAIPLAVFAGGAWLLAALLSNSRAGFAILALLTSTLLAQRSLYDHVRAVAAPLAAADLPTARAALRNIVGRDVEQLDEAGIAAAATESLAENLSDGVIAPLFWGCAFGFPGIVAYKVINTADSMIGHRTPRHLYFGRIAARLDDLANLVPARLTGLLIVMVTVSRRAFCAMFTDAMKHRSPNAGWPEAAMAGALNIRLSGPRAYHGTPTNEPWLNAAAKPPSARSLRNALAVMVRVCVLAIMFVAVGAALFQR